MRRLKPVLLERVGETVIKRGFKGFACAVSLPISSDGEKRLQVVIFAATQEDAAAVCEYLTSQQMELEHVRPMILGDDRPKT